MGFWLCSLGLNANSYFYYGFVFWASTTVCLTQTTHLGLTVYSKKNIFFLPGRIFFEPAIFFVIFVPDQWRFALLPVL
ncbi:hypothetical protein C7N43_04200 [Sphingobacteriales bacterium UPWRP_1]|nr:hypothetical protein B6N25_04745 [Sphingobacteriales bacterium TSM_CSS]PSJ78269.1 hypothetical protein C7N43_04200 [Sphingobacteriales bacterium UPWRP_1]